MSDGTPIHIRRTRPQSVVLPPEIYAQHDLSPAARHVLGWLLYANVVIDVRGVRRAHNLSEKVWNSIRRELVSGGFYSQRKIREPGGRFRWENEVTDAPLYRPRPAPDPAPAAPPDPAPVPATGRQLPEPASERAQVSQEDFLLPNALDEYRPAIRRAAQAAGLTAELTQLLADEFVGRLRETSAPRVNLPARWLRKAAVAIRGGDVSRWASVGAADREARVGSSPQQTPTRRLSREERDAMMQRAINQNRA